MAISPVAKKLSGMHADVLGAPSGYLVSLAHMPEGVVVSEALGGSHQFVRFFATSKADIKRSAPILLKHAAPGALVWITYPKKTSGVASDLSREEIWDAMAGTGWRPVTQIAIDAVWSALRFRPAQEVKSRK